MNPEGAIGKTFSPIGNHQLIANRSYQATIISIITLSRCLAAFSLLGTALRYGPSRLLGAENTLIGMLSELALAPVSRT